MKRSIYYFMVFLVLSFFSCHKDKNKKNTCSSNLLAFSKTSNDSSKLIGVDAGSGEGLYNLYNFTIYNSPRAGAYNTKDNCYYIFQKDVSGKVILLRYSFNTNKTDVITYSGATSALYFYRNELVYNSVVNKLYYVCYDDSTYSSAGRDRMYEVIIKGTTCNVLEVYSSTKQTFITWPSVDENTGNIYHFFYDSPSSNLYINMFNPMNNTSSTLVNDNHINFMHFSKKDNMIYAIKSIGNGKRDFVKINPKDGSIATIAPLNIPFDSISTNLYSTFDVQTNLFILYNEELYTIGTKDIYWINVTTGDVAKHVSPHEGYFGLKSIQCQ